MRLTRLAHDPGALADFYEEALATGGALCERTWYDRLQVVAEGSAARLWNADGALHEVELQFPAPDSTAPRDATKEVFPGCPLTFRLAELLRQSPLPLERAVLQNASPGKAPAPEVVEKLWHAQTPGTARWRMTSTFVATHHFQLLALVRCEIQAIDQHWSLHRLALSLADGQRDEPLTTGLDFVQLASESGEPIAWPTPDPSRWQELLRATLEEELTADLAAIRTRQENYLRRELHRIDDYFEKYESELTGRAARSHSDTTKIKTTERLAAARAEHIRRRQDQVQRHEIRVIPHLDALVLVAEQAWQTTLSFIQHGATHSLEAVFVPRARRWVVGRGA